MVVITADGQPPYVISLGGTGRDVFVFNKLDWHDEIDDFHHSEHDTIALRLGAKFDTFAEVQAVATPLRGLSELYTIAPIKAFS